MNIDIRNKNMGTGRDSSLINFEIYFLPQEYHKKYFNIFTHRIYAISFYSKFGLNNLKYL